MEQEWKYVASVGRWYRYGENRKHLIAGDDGNEPPTFWFFVFQKGVEIAYGEGLETIEKAKEAAEAV